MISGLAKRGVITGMLFGTCWGLFEGSLYLLKEPATKEAIFIYLTCSAAYYAIFFISLNLLVSLIYLLSSSRTDIDQKQVAGLFSADILFMMTISLSSWNNWDPDALLSTGKSDLIIHVILISGVVFIYLSLVSLGVRMIRQVQKSIPQRKRRIFTCVLCSFSVLPLAAFIVLNIIPSVAYSSDDSRPDVILVLLDALRADHVSCYDYGRTTTPYLDQMAEEGVVFDNAVSQYPASLGSHASIFTSLYPGSHCTYEHNADSHLNTSYTTLAEQFRRAGYNTVAILDNPWVSTRSGLSQGFDTFINRNEIERISCEDFHLFMDRLMLFRYYYAVTGRNNLTTRLGVHWIEGLRSHRPYFLFLHYITIHTPYSPPASYVDHFGGIETKKMMERSPQRFLQELVRDHTVAIEDDLADDLITLYDASIAYTDHELSVFMNALKMNNRKNPRLLVIAADHGESLNRHMPILFEHGDLYDSGLRVPLIFIGDGLDFASRRVNQPVELVDIYPTVLDIASIDYTGTDVQGKSLLSLIEGGPEDEDAMAYSQVGSEDFAIRSSSWKLIERGNGKTVELYDLEDDPMEMVNLSSDKQEKADSLSRSLDEWRSSLSCIFDQPRDSRSFTEDEKNELKALGYLN